MKQKISRMNVPVVFRRWDNTGYAVFKSLRKVVKISTLSVAYLLFANPQSVSATPTDSTAVTRSYDLDEIDVTSEQMPETYSNISRVVVTVTKKEIEQAAVSSINELLEYAANIDIRQRGINGVQADVSIRGGSFDQVLLLLNGVNITDPQTGHHNLNLPIDLSSVERIEILKGPGAWKFGPGAFSGAINIITNTSPQTFLKAETEFGQFALNAQKISAGFQLKKTSHLLSANRSASDGYTDNTDYKQKNIFYHGKLTNANSELSVQAGATDKGFGANSFYTALYPNQYEEVQTYFVSAGYKVQISNFQIDPKIYYRRNNDRFLLFRDNPPLYGNYHTTDVYGGNLLTNWVHGTNGITTMGVDSRTETIFSNNLGQITDSPVFSPVNDTILLNRYHSRSNFSVFAGHKRYFNKLMVNVGLNLTRNTDLKENWFIYPGIDLNYEINSNSSVYASANKTMRMPTYTDLYYTGPNNQGNPDLLPEMATGYELGYKYQHTVFNYSLTGFFMKGENMIDWVRTSLEAKWQTINHTNLNTAGFELMMDVNLLKAFEEQNVLKKLKVSYTNINQEIIESDLISNYSLNYLKHRVDVNFNHLIWRNIQAVWHFSFQDRNGQFEKIENRASVGLVEYDPFLTSDLKIMWSHSGWNIYGSVNNMFDIEYFDLGNVPQPGRWFKLGIVKKIEFR